MSANEEKDAAVVVDLRGTITGKVVLHDIMASIGSTVYMRDGIVVYVKTPDVPPIPPSAMLRIRVDESERRWTKKNTKGYTWRQQRVVDTVKHLHGWYSFRSIVRELPDIQQGTIRQILELFTTRGIFQQKIDVEEDGYEDYHYRYNEAYDATS